LANNNRLPFKHSLPSASASGGFGAARHQASGRGGQKAGKPSTSQRQIYDNQIKPLLALGLDQQAEPLLRLLAQGQTTLPEVLRDLGRILEARGEHQEAEVWFLRWLNQRPKQAAQRLEQAQKAEQLKLLDLALERYLNVLELQEREPEALERASELLLAAGRFAEALPLLHRRLESEPDNVVLWMGASRCEFELGSLDEAARWASQGLALLPNQPFLLAIQARQLQAQAKETDALVLVDRALTLAEASDEWSLVNRLVASILLEQGFLERAETCLEVALATEPGRTDLHLQRAETLLLQNRLQEGFLEYEWRQGTRHGALGSGSPQMPLSPQDGQQPLALVAEGTLGDTLLFSRYAAWLKQQRGLDVRLYVQLPLHRLLSQCLGERLPVEPVQQLRHLHHAQRLPLLSAPAVYGTCQEHPELSSPHLEAEQSNIEQWRRLLQRKPGERLVGINWHGSPLHALTERHKSDIPLEQLEPLASLQNTRLVSLQKGIGSEQLEGCRFRSKFVDQQEAINNELRFEHIAALMSLCDWIVTDDSGPAHLAGCLGLPTIVLLPQLSNWRWGAKGNSSPWYPRTTLLRQVADEGWQPLVAEACQIINNGIQGL
jgi:tetratricopeptide (TPR) repeat protein